MKRRITTTNVINFKIAVLFIFSFILLFAALSVTAYADGETEGTMQKKYVALTFDDGPHPAYTKKILDVLEEKNVTATFFVVGFRAELHPNTLIRMKELNCEIGNHTYEHKDLERISEEDALYQIRDCDDMIFAITGEYPQVYRPPFGKIKPELENRIGITKVLWTVDSCDWKFQDNKSQVLNNILNNVKNNSIILMHDFFEVTLEALPELIDRLKAEGYEFKTVSELADELTLFRTNTVRPYGGI